MKGYYAETNDPRERPRTIKLNINYELTGAAQRKFIHDGADSIYNCRLILQVQTPQLELPPRMSLNRITRFVESCLENYVCDNLREGRNYYIEDKPKKKFCFPSGKPGAFAELEEATGNTEAKGDFGSFQGIMNKIIDASLEELMNVLIDKDGAFTFPNITHKCSAGISFVQARARLEITGGKLYGLSNLRRHGPFKLERSGQKLMFSMGVKLPVARLEFLNYTFAYEPATFSLAKKAFNLFMDVSQRETININGDIILTISRMKLSAEAFLDYSKTPCVQRIDKIKILEVSDIDLTLTGLGLVTYIIQEKFNIIAAICTKNIARILEKSFLGAIESHVPDSYCEKFRT
ncbi:uncharacterized protein [Fopius arisanus]|uniref:Uncharacterized protein n=1 Tax=Fopius arisanus TaxID=64838 RepID=A0A9R1TDU6_9HYME|nr:PREDICTED: uncharacterized protein LOC105269689 [Fopius arisanus]